MSNQLIINTYSVLRDEIAQILSAGKERARQAVEREKARTYWEVGGLLQAHLLVNKDRAGYGKQVIPRLAKAVGVGERILYESLRFHRTFPILHARAELTWAHYRTLMKIPGEADRYFFAQEANRLGWSSRELALQIQAGSLTAEGEERKQPERGTELQAKRGRLFTYRLIEAPSGRGLRLDLGFGILLEWPLDRLNKPQEGTFVESVREPGDGEPEYRLRAVRGKRAAFYSYRAYVDRVIDGDTLWLDVDCGFRVVEPAKSTAERDRHARTFDPVGSGGQGIRVVCAFRKYVCGNHDDEAGQVRPVSGGPVLSARKRGRGRRPEKRPVFESGAYEEGIR